MGDFINLIMSKLLSDVSSFLSKSLQLFRPRKETAALDEDGPEGEELHTEEIR